MTHATEHRAAKRRWRWDRFCFWASKKLGGREVFRHSTQMPPKMRRDGRIDLIPGVCEYSLGRCYACGTSWKWARGHSTPYTDRSSCFPLCEQCWAGMTPEQRLPYYSMLVAEWVRELGPIRQDDWEPIKAAVLEGK